MNGYAVRQIIITTVLLGTIGVAFNVLFGENTMVYVGQELIPNTAISWYRLDLNAYIQNLKTMITDTTQLELKLPTKHWIRIVQSFEDIGHNLAIVLDYIILIINVLIYPLRLGGYLLRFLIALLGLNTGSNSSLNWLGIFVNNLVSLAIPYI